MRTIINALVVTCVVVAVHAQTNKLDSTGNVGIGTTTPGAKLEVVEDGSVLYTWLRSYSNISWQAPRIGTYRYRGSHANPSAVLAGDELFSFEVSGRNANGTETYAGGFGFYATGTVIGNSVPSYLAFYTSGGDSGTERMRIAESGNVGISRPDPVARLDVQGTTADSTAWVQWLRHAYGSVVFGVRNDGFVVMGNGVVDHFVKTADGNVGIGTTSPSARLHTHGASDGTNFYFTTAGATAGWNGGAYSDNSFRINQAGVAVRFIVDASGNVGIGTTSPTHKLAVNGTIRAKEVIVDNTGWADHVFAADYRLAPLSEVEQHIQQNGHLPDVPSDADVAARGVSVGEMQKILLQKIEELTLYVIAQEKLLCEQKQQLGAQAARVSALEQENSMFRRQFAHGPAQR